VFKGDMDAFGKKEEFYSATTYRLTEHFHYWTKHARLNAIVQPEQFVEIGEELAKEKGIQPATRSRSAATAATSRPRRWSPSASSPGT
jgi:formate dehydrogenase major subunit